MLIHLQIEKFTVVNGILGEIVDQFDRHFWFPIRNDTIARHGNPLSCVV